MRDEATDTERVAEHALPRFGPWVQTFKQRRISLLDPSPNDIDLEDMAHALSLTCRYNGHVPHHYSVAQHSVVALLALEALHPDASPQDRQGTLLHDGHEYILGDQTKPLLCIAELGALIKELRRRADAAIATRFGVPLQSPAAKSIDARMLATEARLWFTGTQDWFLEAEPFDDEAIIASIRFRASPEAAEREFLRHCERLGIR